MTPTCKKEKMPNAFLSPQSKGLIQSIFNSVVLIIGGRGSTGKGTLIAVVVIVVKCKGELYPLKDYLFKEGGREVIHLFEPLSDEVEGRELCTVIDRANSQRCFHTVFTTY